MKGKKLEILKELAQEGNEALTQQQLADKLGCNRSTISYHLTSSRKEGQEEDNSLEAQNYVDVEKEGRKKLYFITEQGKQIVVTAESGQAYPLDSSNNSNNSNQEGTTEGIPDKDVHNFSVKVGIENLELFNDDWKEQIVEKSERNWEEKDGSVDEFVTYWKNTKVRLTGKNVIIRLEDRIHALDTTQAKNKAIDCILEAREWVEDQLYPIRLKDEMKIIRQHIAIGTEDQECPLARFIDEETEMDLKDFSVDDSEGVERIWMDRSDGRQTEAGNSPGQNREYAEDDVDTIDEFLRSMIEDDIGLEDFKEARNSRERDYEDRIGFMERAMEFLMMKELRREKRRSREEAQEKKKSDIEEEARLNTLEKRMKKRMNRLEEDE